MYRVVEINPTPTPPPPPKKPAQKKQKKILKNKLSKEDILSIIKAFEKSSTRFNYWKGKYEHISKKYNIDLAEFIKREGENLPSDDWGKKVLHFYKIKKKAIGKLRFYKKLLKEKEDEQKQQKKPAPPVTKTEIKEAVNTKAP